MMFALPYSPLWGGGVVIGEGKAHFRKCVAAVSCSSDNKQTKSISCGNTPIMMSQAQVNRTCPLPPNQHHAPTHAPPPMHGAASPLSRCMGRPHQANTEHSYPILLLCVLSYSLTTILAIIGSQLGDTFKRKDFKFSR